MYKRFSKSIAVTLTTIENDFFFNFLSVHISCYLKNLEIKNSVLRALLYSLLLKPT